MLDLFFSPPTVTNMLATHLSQTAKTAGEGEGFVFDRGKWIVTARGGRCVHFSSEQRRGDDSFIHHPDTDR